ncbi:hypothetical protein RKD27_004064 [Streptomyces sp. SAI-126]
MPSSHGRSEPPSASIESRRRHASMNVADMTSSATDQSAVSRKAWLYTERAHWS